MGLSKSGKKVSERHDEAKADGKLTAGEAVKFLKKKGITCSAKSLVEDYKLIKGTLPEWHHSGFYKKGGKSTMGRTYFFSKNDIDFLIKNQDKLKALQAEEQVKREKKAKAQIKGLYWYWSHDYSGRYGKKQYHKVLGVYEGSELTQPKNFIKLTPKQFAKAKKVAGKKYYGWDEPTASEFN